MAPRRRAQQAAGSATSVAPSRAGLSVDKQKALLEPSRLMIGITFLCALVACAYFLARDTGNSKQIVQRAAVGEVKGAAAAGVSQVKIPEFTFSGSSKMLPHGGEEFTGDLPKPCDSNSSHSPSRRKFTLLRGVAKRSAKELRTISAQLSKSSWGMHPDEVDGQPAYELYVLAGGSLAEGLDQLGPEQGTRLKSALQSVLDKILTPYIRERYNCDRCLPCTAFLRRYRPGERRLNPTHYDMEAFVTVVLSLSGHDEYQGGLYVQATPHASSRQLLRMEIGDALVHQYDLNHGVAVTGGERYSLVVWVSSTEDACQRAESPWYKADAHLGDADAQWNLGNLLKRGTRGYDLDPAAALHWYTQSAEAGHPGAMNSLALLLDDSPAASNASNDVPRKWFSRSAQLGDANGQLNWAAQLASEGLHAEAFGWYHKAALQGSPSGMTSMANLLGTGKGCKRDVAAAVSWYKQAADQGHRPAYAGLGQLYTKLGREKEALQWLSTGATAGSADCMLAIAERYLEGRGLPKSQEKAIDWMKRAAEADGGSAAARALLAQLTEISPAH